MTHDTSAPSAKVGSGDVSEAAKVLHSYAETVP